MTEHVKVYGVKPRIQYVADGSLTTYDFPFATFKASDIEVYLQDIKQATNTYTVLDAGSSDGGRSFSILHQPLEQLSQLSEIFPLNAPAIFKKVPLCEQKF